MTHFTRAAHSGYFTFLKCFSIAIGAVIGLVCKCSPLQHSAPAYGIPMASYKISGTILAADTRQAIPNIRLTLKDTLSTGSEYPPDSAFSDTAGRYSLEFSRAPGDTTWRIEASDIDGNLNGSFAPRDTIVSVPQSSLTGASGSDNMGHAEKTVDISLDRNP